MSEIDMFDPVQVMNRREERRKRGPRRKHAPMITILDRATLSMRVNFGRDRTVGERLTETLRDRGWKRVTLPQSMIDEAYRNPGPLLSAIIARKERERRARIKNALGNRKREKMESRSPGRVQPADELPGEGGSDSDVSADSAAVSIGGADGDPGIESLATRLSEGQETVEGPIPSGKKEDQGVKRRMPATLPFHSPSTTDIEIDMEIETLQTIERRMLENMIEKEE